MPCELCDRPVQQLTVHHLIPRQYTRRRKLDPGPTIALCFPCHKQIHSLFDNRFLARELNTSEKLRSHPDMVRFLRWIRKQDAAKRIRTDRARSSN